jgi:NADP-dependent 3-hydroxy acid dehydrogenase YdfG
MSSEAQQTGGGFSRRESGRQEDSRTGTARKAPLHGHIALVTGGSQGIGKAIALGLAAAGAGLCLVGRELQKLQAVGEEAGAEGREVVTYRADLTVDEDLQQLCSRVAHDVPRLDVLVHCAGMYARGPMGQASLEEFDALFRANVRAPYALTRALLPLLRSACGQVVFVNSSVGLQAPAGVGQFAATQHALKAIADSLRQEVNADGVRVLSVYPGRTATPRQAIIFQMEGRRYEPHLLMQPEDVASAVVHALCLPRTAEVTDISIRPLRKPTDASHGR